MFFLLDNHVCLFPTGWCIRVCKKVAGGASWRNIFNIDWDCQSCIDQLPRCFFIYKLAAIGHTCPPPFGKRWKYHLYYSQSDRPCLHWEFYLWLLFLPFLLFRPDGRSGQVTNICHLCDLLWESRVRLLDWGLDLQVPDWTWLDYYGCA